MLLTNQPSATAAFNWTAEYTSQPKNGSGAGERSGSRRKLGVKRASKAMKKLEKAGRRSQAIPSQGKISIKILVSSAAAYPADASTGTSSNRYIHVVEVNDDGELRIRSRSTLGQDGTSGSQLVLLL